jgi:hypothetical protein
MNTLADIPLEDDAAAARTAARVARLDILVEIGLGLTQRLQREVAEAEPGTVELGSVALAFSRLAKAVRQTIALQARLEAPPAETAAGERSFWDRPLTPPVTTPSASAAAARAPSPRNTVAAAVGLAIDEAAGDDDAEFERLDDALDDELDALDEDAFDRRPIGAIVVEICEALGVAPDLSLWEDEDWAIEEARTGPPGSPYAGRAGVEAGEAAARGPDGATSAVLDHPPP